MSLRCASCRHENDPTWVYCHKCGARLERGSAAASATGFTHPTDVVKIRKPGKPADWGRYVGAFLRLLIPALLVLAIVLAILPPRDVPPPVVPDKALAARLSGLVAASSAADSVRAFTVQANDVNTWLATSVALKQKDGIVPMKPERVYAVAGDGDIRVGLHSLLPLGVGIYFEGSYAPVPRNGGYGLAARNFSVGRLPLPSFAGVLVERQFESLAGALAVPLGHLARASFIGITPEKVNLRWSGTSR